MYNTKKVVRNILGDKYCKNNIKKTNPEYAWNNNPTLRLNILKYEGLPVKFSGFEWNDLPNNAKTKITKFMHAYEN